jgi:hypothetical protein
MEFPMLAGGDRLRGKLSFQRKKNKNFLDLQSILFEPFESLNMGTSDLFPSDISGASKWQSTVF